MNLIDIVGMGSLLHLLKTKDRKIAINEAARVLKPSGYFIAGNITTVTKSMPPRNTFEAILLNPQHIYQQIAYQNYLKKAGLRMLDAYMHVGLSGTGKFLVCYNFVAQKPPLTSSELPVYQSSEVLS